MVKLQVREIIKITFEELKEKRMFPILPCQDVITLYLLNKAIKSYKGSKNYKWETINISNEDNLYFHHCNSIIGNLFCMRYNEAIKLAILYKIR